MTLNEQLEIQYKLLEELHIARQSSNSETVKRFLETITGIAMEIDSAVRNIHETFPEATKAYFKTVELIPLAHQIDPSLNQEAEKIIEDVELGECVFIKFREGGRSTSFPTFKSVKILEKVITMLIAGQFYLEHHGSSPDLYRKQFVPDVNGADEFLNSIKSLDPEITTERGAEWAKAMTDLLILWEKVPAADKAPSGIYGPDKSPQRNEFFHARNHLIERALPFINQRCGELATELDEKFKTFYPKGEPTDDPIAAAWFPIHKERFDNFKSINYQSSKGVDLRESAFRWGLKKYIREFLKKCGESR
jgi:hypothetical protein